jgi:hypothetical protein
MSKFRNRLLMTAALGFCGGAHLVLAEPVAPAPAAPAVAAVAPVDPTEADKVIARFIEVTGGRAAYDAVKSRRMSIEMSIPAQNMTITMTGVQKDATNGKMVANIAGMGEVTTGRAGDFVYEVNGISNSTRLVEGPEAEQMKRSLTLNEVDMLKEMFPQRTLAGREPINGKDADRIELKSDSGAMTIWYDVESGLAVQNAMVVTTQMGPMEVKSTISDYKDFGGIKIPTLMKQTMMGMEMILKTTNVEVNAEIKADEVAPPAEIQKLIDAKK